VVVIGGGAGGAAAARALVAGFEDLDVELIVEEPQYVTPFFANRFLGELSPLARFTFGYGRLNGHPRLTVIQARATGIDIQRRRVDLSNGGMVGFDRLIVAPGVAITPGGLPGYDGQAESRLPHAYLRTSAGQWNNLHHRLSQIPDGGVVAISVPKRPYRCHPAPYERAALIATRLRATKPRAKVLILDANDSFPLMDVYQEDWEKRFGDLLEWIPGDFGGAVTAVEPATGTLVTSDERLRPDVANVIPPHRAGEIARVASLADASGWCPVDAASFESRMAPAVHVIGDAADAGDMPKSAFGAGIQAQVCAIAVGRALTGQDRPLPELRNACYFLLTEGAGLVVGGRYSVANSRIAGVEGHASQLGEDPAERARTAESAEHWFKRMVADMFG